MLTDILERCRDYAGSAKVYGAAVMTASVLAFSPHVDAKPPKESARKVLRVS